MRATGSVISGANMIGALSQNEAAKAMLVNTNQYPPDQTFGEANAELMMAESLSTTRKIFAGILGEMVKSTVDLSDKIDQRLQK